MKLLKKTSALYLILFILFLLTVTFLVTNAITERQSLNSKAQEVTPDEAPRTKSRSRISNDRMDRLLKAVEQRATLSDNDTRIREQLQQSADANGVLISTSTFQAEYLSAPDIFHVEIRTVDVAQAKIDAITYFTDYGLSDDAICNLPVVFYLSSEVEKTISDSPYIFDPLASGC